MRLFLTINFFAIAVFAKTTIDIPYSASLSPDGSKIVFSWNDDLWLSAREGGIAKRLSMSPGLDYQAIFSHDGTKIAFESNRFGPNYLFTMPASGGPATQVSFNSEGYNLLQWYRDNKSLAFNSNRKLYTPRQGSLPYKLDTETQEAETLIFNSRMREFHMSSDESKILFTREGSQKYRKGYRGSQASQIWLFDKSKNSFEKILHKDWNCRTPLWDYEHKGFYYLSDESGSSDLYHFNLTTNKSKRLHSGNGDHLLNLNISSDGSTLIWRHLFHIYTWRPAKDKIPLKANIHTSEDLSKKKSENRLVREVDTFDISKDGLEMTFAKNGLIYVCDSIFTEPQRISSQDQFCIEPIFSNDFSKIYYLKDMGHEMSIVEVVRSNEDIYWWQNHNFIENEIFNYRGSLLDLNISPDDKMLSFVSGDGTLWTYDIERGIRRKIVSCWMAPDYSWSPDGQWFVYAAPNENYNKEIFLIASDASTEPYNLSRNPATDSSPVWSPDGSKIAYISDRSRTDKDIVLVYLKKEDFQQSARFIKFNEALEHMKDNRKKTKKVDPEKKEVTSDKKLESENNEIKEEETKSKNVDKKELKKTSKKEEEKKEEEKKEEEKKEDNNEADDYLIQIDWDGLHDRNQHIRRIGSHESRPIFYQNSESLICRSEKRLNNGKYDFDAIYRVSLDDRKFTFSTFNTSNNYPVKALEKNGYFSSISYRKAAVLKSKNTKKFEYNFYHTINLNTEKEIIFAHCWRQLNEKFYDKKMNNLNWDDIYKKYFPAAKSASSLWRLGTVINMMLGELNASHLGFYPNVSYPSIPTRLITAHTGLRYYRQNNKLFIDHVIPKSPAANIRHGFKKGDEVIEINHRKVDSKTNLDKILTGLDHQTIHIKVKNEQGEINEQFIESISPSKTRTLLDEEMIDRLRLKTHELSQGSATYLHINKMNFDSFYKFHDELYSKAYGMDGLIIDVRDNSGGNTADHLLTILTQPDHAFCQARDHKIGYPDDRSIYSPWKKPIVVLCNQNSYSNAEIFTHAIISIGRGKVVGVPSAGGVISTWSSKILGRHRFRLPMRGWFVSSSGQDMELNGAIPNFVIWPEAGDMSSNKDPQLRKAIDVLMKDIKDWKEKRSAIKPLRANTK